MRVAEWIGRGGVYERVPRGTKMRDGDERAVYGNAKNRDVTETADEYTILSFV
jgi:hypothetical protein